MERASYFVSARWGLIRPTDRIDTYNLRMGQPGSATPLQVATQAHTYGIGPGVGVYAFLLKRYERVLFEACSTILGTTPLDGFEAAPGIGFQRGVIAHLG